jgi:hypothetical protein
LENESVLRQPVSLRLAMMMTIKFQVPTDRRFPAAAMSLILLVAVLVGCRHAPASIGAQSFPVICTEAIPATNRVNLEQLKDVPVPEIVQFGGLKYRKSEPAYVGCYKFR